MKNLSTIGWSVLTPCALALGVVFAAAAAERTTFAFTLPRDAITSAGVYDSQGRLLRTLWRANKLPAGVHLSDWDGTDDAGKSYAGREIVLKVIHHRVNPVWEGVIGNSSASLGDSKVHRAFHPPSSLLPIAGKMYYAVGYNEWQPGIHGFSLSAPQADTRPIAATDDAFVSHSMLTSDGTRLYWANTGGVSRTSFVGAFHLATAQRYLAEGQYAWNAALGVHARKVHLPEFLAQQLELLPRTVLQERDQPAHRHRRHPHRHRGSAQWPHPGSRPWNQEPHSPLRQDDG